VHIDIWSDVICPWCYLGSRRLAAALDRFDRDVTVRWHAFELDPGAPPEPGDLRAALERKYGPGSFDAMTGRLTALGEADGIEYRFDRALRVNTFDAHRLVDWAVTQPAGQDGIVTSLFRAYFTDGEDVSDHATLVRLAAAAGLDAELAGEVLASGAHAEEVRADEAQARELDITGVPAFVVDQRVLIPGAQDVDTIVRVLERTAERSNS
jgi:predicted DsbA family dithiol-disulfide isomerase